MLGACFNHCCFTYMKTLWNFSLIGEFLKMLQTRTLKVLCERDHGRRCFWNPNMQCVGSHKKMLQCVHFIGCQEDIGGSQVGSICSMEQMKQGGGLAMQDASLPWDFWGIKNDPKWAGTDIWPEGRAAELLVDTTAYPAEVRPWLGQAWMQEVFEHHQGKVSPGFAQMARPGHCLTFSPRWNETNVMLVITGVTLL